MDEEEILQEMYLDETTCLVYADEIESSKFQEAFQELETLLKENASCLSDNIQYQYFAASFLTMNGFLYWNDDQQKEAVNQFLQAKKHADQFIAKLPMDSRPDVLSSDLSDMAIRCADSLQQIGFTLETYDSQLELDFLTDSAALFKWLFLILPDDKSDQVPTLFARIGMLCVSLNLGEKASYYFKKAEKLQTMIYQVTEDPVYLVRALSIRCNALQYQKIMQDDFGQKEHLQILDEIKELDADLKNEPENIQAQAELYLLYSAVYSALFNAASGSEDRDNAEKYLSHSVDSINKAAQFADQLDESEDMKKRVCMSRASQYSTAAEFYHGLERWEEAQKYSLDALTLMEGLDDVAPAAGLGLLRITMYRILGDVGVNTDDENTAKFYFTQAASGASSLLNYPNQTDARETGLYCCWMAALLNEDNPKLAAHFARQGLNICSALSQSSESTYPPDMLQHIQSQLIPIASKKEKKGFFRRFFG